MNTYNKAKLTLLQILAGSTSGRTCCMRELATHWSRTAAAAAAVAAAAAAARTAVVDSHRAGSTAPTDHNQPVLHQQREKKIVLIAPLKICSAFNQEQIAIQTLLEK